MNSNQLDAAINYRFIVCRLTLRLLMSYIWSTYSWCF